MNQSNNFEDEINLDRIFEKLITYKTLILTITLFFSIAVSVFTIQIQSQYKSFALIEIGNYKTIDGISTPIESSSSLINNININLLYKNIFGDKKGYQISPIDGSIVKIERKSYSIEDNEKSLKKIIDFTINRHQNISEEAINLEIKSLENELDNVNNRILFIQEVLISELQNEDKKRINSIIELERELPYLNNKINEVNKIIKADEKNLIILESNPELLLKRATQSPTLNQIIHDYKMQLLDFEKLKESTISKLEKLRNTQFLNSDNSEEQAAINAEKVNIASSSIFDLQQKKNNIETQIKLTKNQIQNETKIINKITNTKLDNRKPLIIISGVFIGFLISLLISFIMDSFKKGN